MPISLPSSLTPQSVSWTRNRPRSIVQSDFTGFTQQVLSGTHFMSGEMTLPPLNATQAREWQKFFADLEALNADGTFWVPIWSHDYDPDDATGINWERADVISSLRRELEVRSPSDTVKALENQLGRFLQFRVRSRPDASFILTLTGYSLRPAQGANPETAVLTYAEAYPAFTAGTNFDINTGNKLLARALLPDPASQSLVMDAVTSSVVAPITIPWTEAIGAILADIAI